MGQKEDSGPSHPRVEITLLSHPQPLVESGFSER
jgi:hypothetical protein